ncbi:hypothetical protein IYY11_11280 [Methylocystis sp. H62]|uniref:hypothetical protein n=1 Tax=Methylocystis sp. H62 TaxID=2785789 RepID=UPI0018C225BD|nr:hypothetical protein [Methylocystis sp. H62]MBG0793955.1 hypothetical protein [Methylocystis sp. H62]
MAQEPDNLVLELLRGMRGDIADLREGVRGVQNDIRSVRNVQDTHTLRFDFIEGRVETLREAMMTALGFAVNADEKHKKIEVRLAELTERVEKLEKAK